MLLAPALGWGPADGHGGSGGHHTRRMKVAATAGRNFEAQPGSTEGGGREMRAPRQQGQREGRDVPRREQGQQYRGQQRPGNQREMRDQQRPDYRQGRPAARGRDGLPQWWQQHRELSPQQQADALRRQPGFRNLPQPQQQRLINRLHEFDRRSPREQQRTLGRVEMFQRLSPERKQEGRGASQALSRMPPQRQQEVRQAFRELRQGLPGSGSRCCTRNTGHGSRLRSGRCWGTCYPLSRTKGKVRDSSQVPQPYFGRH